MSQEVPCTIARTGWASTMKVTTRVSVCPAVFGLCAFASLLFDLKGLFSPQHESSGADRRRLKGSHSSFPMGVISSFFAVTSAAASSALR